jgi:hypothetical protein
VSDIHRGNLVLVEYYNPKTGFSESRPGWLLKAPDHIIAVQEKVEGIDLYSYTVIPKGLVSRIIQLRIK